MKRRAVGIVLVAVISTGAGCNLISGVGDIDFNRQPDAGPSDAGSDAGMGGSGGGGGGAGGGGAPDAGNCPDAPPACVATKGQSLQSCCDGGPCAQVDVNADAANCGACGHPCSGSEVCRCGACQPLIQLAGAQDGPWGLAVDTDHGVLYWSNNGSAGLNDLAFLTLPIDGCGAMPAPFTGDPPLMPGQTQVGIAWSPTGGVHDASKGAVAADATSWYFTDAAQGTVSKLVFGAGSPSMLATGQATPSGIGVIGGTVYWSNYGDGTVRMAKADGSGQPAKLADGGPNPWKIAVDSTTVYWTSQNSADKTNGSVMKMIPGDAAPTTLISGQSKPWGIAVDKDHVYWTTSEGGTVMRRSHSDGLVTTIAVKQSHPQSITVDDKNVYWVNSGSTSTPSTGSVKKWAK